MTGALLHLGAVLLLGCGLVATIRNGRRKRRGEADHGEGGFGDGGGDACGGDGGSCD